MFEQGFAKAWFMSDGSTGVKKRTGKDIDLRQVYNAFKRRAAPHEVMARLIGLQASEESSTPPFTCTSTFQKCIDALKSQYLAPSTFRKRIDALKSQ